MKTKNLKSTIAFSLALCMIIPLTATIDNITDVLAIGDSTSKTEPTTSKDDNGSIYIQKSDLTSIELELQLEATANGVVTYWDNTLADIDKFLGMLVLM